MKKLLITSIEVVQVPKFPYSVPVDREGGFPRHPAGIRTKEETVYPRTFYKSRGVDVEAFELAMTSKVAETLGLPFEVMESQAAELQSVQEFRKKAHDFKKLRIRVKYLENANSVLERENVAQVSDIEDLNEYAVCLREVINSASFLRRLKYLFTGRLFTLMRGR